jgi:hypothetical protein
MVHRHRKDRRGGTLWEENEIVEMEEIKGDLNILGPTPVKSSLSMTSECWEAFLGRPVLVFARSTAFAA